MPPGLAAVLIAATYLVLVTCAALGQQSGVIDGAPILAGAADIADPAEQIALVVPRGAAPGSPAELALPTPLSPSDAALARRVFAAQAAGQMVAAEREAAALSTPLLNGPILADRALRRARRAEPAALRAWLAAYGDQPDAPIIRALLRRRLPKDAALPPDRAPARLAPERTAGTGAEDAPPADSGPAPDPTLARAVLDRVQGQEYGTALGLINAAEDLPPEVAAQLRTELARALFTHGWDSPALEVATAAWRQVPAEARPGCTALVAGLAAWRLGRLASALDWFSRAAHAPVAPASVRAAGAFWAARAALRLHDPVGYQTWLRRAAVERRTFHGLIARHILGWGTGLILGREILSQADVDALASMPRGLRAFALLQVGQRGRAEAELRALWPEVADSAPLRRALLLATAGAHLTDLAAQLAGLVQTADAVPNDALLFPVHRLAPTGGFVVDPALVYGVARTESNFDAAAVSSAGAHGLMQIRPITARAVSGNLRLKAAALHDPGINLELGQRVLLTLAGLPSVHDDLIRLLASYNAGPSSVAGWAPGLRDDGDPMLFIEAIPLPETRRFVQRALANTWIYAARLGLPAPSLDDMAAGRWPQVAPTAEGVATAAGWLRTVHWTRPLRIPHARHERVFAGSGA